MIVTVTGASGHLGGHLVRTLLAEKRPGLVVRALVKDDVRPLEGLPVEKVHGDILDPDSLRRAFDGAEVVYHLAARISLVHGDEPLVRTLNVDGVKNVVEAVRAAGVRRLVHFSSIHAYTPHPVDGTVDETWGPADQAPHAPIYDRTKAAGERIVREAVEKGDLDAVIINPTGCLGPLDFKPSAAGQALLDLALGRIPMLVDGGFNWVDARDVAKAAVAAETRAPKGSRYIVGGHWMHIRDVAATVAELNGTRAPRIVLPMWFLKTIVPVPEAYTRLFHRPVRFTNATLHALRHHRHISDERARREIGHAPRPFRETVADSLAWFRENGFLPAAKNGNGATEKRSVA